MRSAVAAIAFAYAAAALDNGVGVKPQLGWRSWNAYHANVNEDLMKAVVDAMANRSRSIDGKPTALGDIYPIIGLDDNWQNCSAGVNGTFHNSDGSPIISSERFPNGMKGWVQYAAAHGLKAGWYFNNCICKEKIPRMGPEALRDLQGDAKAAIEFGFAGVKLDGCGPEEDIAEWAGFFNASGSRMHVENCHNGPTALGRIPASYPIDKPVNRTFCPYHQARSSTDIQSNWPSIFSNLQSTRPYQDLTNPQSRPGCWAYPDMLEVGKVSSTESRSHFGAWCIVSSPLTLSFDVTNATAVDELWDVITNPEAIAVNQQWAGHPGRVAAQSPPGTTEPAAIHWQVWTKPQADGKAAVLFVNNDNAPNDISLPLSTIGMSKASVRDIWARSDAPDADGTLEVHGLGSHDSRFFLLTPQ